MNFKKRPVSKTRKEVESQKRDQNPIVRIFFKLGIISLLFICGLVYLETQGIFNPDNRNNHTKRKWDAFYDFTAKSPIDILLLGNSHLYTGINPKNLSAAMGCNSFILASPGTNVLDYYYSLKEALKISKPKLVVIETYGLKKVTPFDLKEGPLSDQFKSFQARKHWPTKLESTLNLFAPKNYVYAWSNAIRNHDFLYKDFEQIEKNIALSNSKTKKSQKLYLGRFVRFQTGIEEAILQKYVDKGAPVDGGEYESNDVLEEYVQKIVDLCNENDIELMFLTLPMYEQHVQNYDKWKSGLSNVLGDYSTDNYWLDLQDKRGYKGFTTSSFENTYKINQHMTYGGSLIATCKVVDYIHEYKKGILPKRNTERNWRKLFYGEEGFFENNSPGIKDTKNIQLYKGRENEIIEEVLLLNKGKYNSVLTKICPRDSDHFDQLINRQVAVNLTIKEENGSTKDVWLNLKIDKFHSSNNRICFITNINPIKVLKFNSYKLI